MAAFSYVNIINRWCTTGSNPNRVGFQKYPSCLFLRTQGPLNSLDPDPNPINKINRVRIPNAIHHPSSYVASFAAFAMLTRSVANDVLTVGKELRTLADEFIPREYQDYYLHEMKKLLVNKDAEFTIVIDEYPLQLNSSDEMFEAVATYLATKVNESCIRRVNVYKNKDTLAIKMNENEEIIDEFDGVKVKWRLVTKIKSQSVTKRYELTFHNRHRFMILESYLPYVLQRSDEIKAGERGLKIHMISNGNGYPDSKTIVLDNPMTFETLAMEPELKKSIIEDLNSFKSGQEYYKRIGKAWKRGYLIYGPSGTGKSSLIASMANHLNYDVYDVDVTEVNSDSKVKSILLEMPSKSILVFEDLDQLQCLTADGEVSRKRQKSFSRLLSFMDGIWSCCGEEQIFVFTTRCTDKLDQDLIRPGRIDVHIRMTYCTFSTFKQLAFNYLELEEHKLFGHVEELLKHVNVTLADVAGELMKFREDATMSLEKLIAYLEEKTSL